MRELPKFVEALVTGRPSLQEVFDSVVDEWSPDPPPVTTAMSALGTAAVRTAERLGGAEVQRLFDQIDQLLALGTQEEKDAVATGFLEAVANAVDRDPEKRWVRAMAGPRAQDYLNAWDEFCGLEAD